MRPVSQLCLSRQALITWRGFAACRLGPVRCYLRPDVCRCGVLKLHRDTVCPRHSGRPIEMHSDHSGYKRAVTVKNAFTATVRWPNLPQRRHESSL